MFFMVALNGSLGTLQDSDYKVINPEISGGFEEAGVLNML